MSTSIPTSFVEQFSAELRILSQQRMSKLRSTVLNEGAIGEAVAVEFIGGKGIRANIVDTRHGDTPINNTPHLRRWVYPVDYDYADLLDEEDVLRLIANPASAYAQVHAAIFGREIDIEIVRALGGTAKAGKNATEDKALPSGQQFINNDGSTAGRLKVADLIKAKEMLDTNEVDEMYPRFMAVNAKGIANLLQTTEVTSADYNSVRALVAGEINTFVGFNIIRCERVAANEAWFFAQPAVCLKTWREPHGS